MSSDSQQTAITRADLDALKAEILGALNLLLRDPVRLSILTARRTMSLIRKNNAAAMPMPSMPSSEASSHPIERSCASLTCEVSLEMVRAGKGRSAGVG